MTFLTCVSQGLYILMRLLFLTLKAVDKIRKLKFSRLGWDRLTSDIACSGTVVEEIVLLKQC